MKDIAIYGAGGFGKEIACLIDRINQERNEWNLIGFFDDGKEKETQISHYGKVLGGITELNNYPKELYITIAIGKPANIEKIFKSINNSYISFPNLIEPTFKCVDSTTFNIGIGNIIQSGCRASCDVEIGSFNILNSSVAMGHDAKIGDFNVIMPATRISGEVTINNGNLLGVGSIILQQVTIGNNITIGAGSVLMTKPKDGCTYIGNPAKLFKF